jgi:drug/metabolite transporter (DMT)-like permease
MTLAPTAAVFFSETVLSLYPILIKKVTTNINTQTLSRFLIYPLAALIIGGLKPLASAYAQNPFKNLVLGSANVAHVASSYIAFQQLPAGIAMSLFYTYPLWNIIGASIVFGEPFPWHLAPIVLVAITGAIIVAFSRTDKEKSEGKSINWYGVAAALAAALTETILFLSVKSVPKETPFFSIHQLYLGGLPILIAYLLYKWTSEEEKTSDQEKNPVIDWKWKTWLPLLAFNGILGFSGYVLRFWSIPRLSTILYSILSMFGVLAAFTWGHFLADEPVQGQGLLGATILTAAIGWLRYSIA